MPPATEAERPETAQASPPAAQPRRRLLLENTLALYGVQAGRKLIPLASIPYLARVLGPEAWGQVAFATAMGDLVVILIEFGFNISATRLIARHRNHRNECAPVIAGVLGAQVCLASAGVLAALVAAPLLPIFRARPALLAYGLIYATAQGFLPVWYFQGMERMKLAALLELCGKGLALTALFVFVQTPAHAARTLLVQAFSPGAMTAIGLWLALRENPVRFPRWAQVRMALADGWNMFLFRGGESLYGVANAFLLGLYAPAQMVGYFASAEKISKATAGLLNPIRESLYPRISYVLHHNPQRARELSRLGARLMVVGGLALSIALFFAADLLVSKLMGGRFEPAVTVLRLLSPLPFVLALTFSAGQLYLLPQKRDREMTRAILAGSVLNLVLSFFLAPRWGHIGMAITVMLSEIVVALALLFTLSRRPKPINV